MNAGSIMLLTTDHGYSVHEEDGMLYITHGKENDPILDLEQVALFAVLERSEL